MTRKTQERVTTLRTKVPGTKVPTTKTPRLLQVSPPPIGRSIRLLSLSVAITRGETGREIVTVGLSPESGPVLLSGPVKGSP